MEGGSGSNVVYIYLNFLFLENHIAMFYWCHVFYNYVIANIYLD